MKRALPILNIVAYVATLIVNFLSQAETAPGIRLFPFTIQELGSSRAVLFLPANYVFSIWGIIYTALGAYVIYQALPANRNSRVHHAIGYWFIVASIANCVWLALFLNDLVAASTVAMLLLLTALVVIYLRLGIGRAKVSRGEFWAVHVGFSIYLGWIAVATVANFATTFYQGGSVSGFLGIPADLWTIALMVVAALLAVAMLVRHQDIAYAGVAVWALIGIYARPFTTSVYDVLIGKDLTVVNNSALVIALAVLIALIYTVGRMLLNRNNRNLKAV